MARKRLSNCTSLIWERMNYAQKCAVYRFATGFRMSYHFPERVLNQWWFSLSPYDRRIIIDDLMEFLNDAN